MASAFGLLAPVAMMLNGFVQAVVCAGNAVLAIVVVSVGVNHRLFKIAHFPGGMEQLFEQQDG